MENISIGQFTNMEVKMLDKIEQLFDALPDTLKAIIVISVIAIFWDIVL